MATVKEIKRKTGRSAFQVQYNYKGGRKYLSLGSDYDREDAVEIGLYVDRMVAALETEREFDKRTNAWLGTISDDLRERLARSGLIEVEKVPTLREIFKAYWNAEIDGLKETSVSCKKNARRRFFEYVDEETPFDQYAKKDAAEFVEFLKTQVGEASRAGIIRDLRRVFNWAKDAEMIDRNPFDGIKRGSFKNKEKEYYIPMDDYEKMLDACPSKMWRALLALYRIGGLRYEEALRVQWSDVDFARGRLLVHSPKTERYKGRDSRVVPLFPKLRTELESLWEETEEGGSPFVIAENRTTIRKHVERIVFFAGLNRWARLIQNFRSSRAIEIAREFGELAESEWIGHSPQTARDHYLHVLDEDFERAAAVPEKPKRREGRRSSSVPGSEA